jgi:hypothetical protein
MAPLKLRESEPRIACPGFANAGSVKAQVFCAEHLAIAQQYGPFQDVTHFSDIARPGCSWSARSTSSAKLISPRPKSAASSRSGGTLSGNRADSEIEVPAELVFLNK